MSAPGGSLPIVYHDDAEMQNAGNGGDGSGQIIPQVVQPDQVEEVGTLVPQATLEAIPMQPTPPGQPFPLFDGPRMLCPRRTMRHRPVLWAETRGGAIPK